LKAMGDENFVNEMIETFIESTTSNLLLLQAEIDKKQWKQVGELLHKIIAPSRHFKANDLVINLKKWEESALNGHPIPEKDAAQMIDEINSLVSALKLHLQEASSHE
jgi:HPt (histidine-containing phosphotransfer) domain-containing protein